MEKKRKKDETHWNALIGAVVAFHVKSIIKNICCKRGNIVQIVKNYE